MELTQHEIQAIKSMGKYWREVAERDDTTPLSAELHTMIGRLGTRLLFILLDYAESAAKEPTS